MSKPDAFGFGQPQLSNLAQPSDHVLLPLSWTSVNAPLGDSDWGATKFYQEDKTLFRQGSECYCTWLTCSCFSLEFQCGQSYRTMYHIETNME